jgi:hypothetical protein
MTIPEMQATVNALLLAARRLWAMLKSENPGRDQRPGLSNRPKVT